MSSPESSPVTPDSPVVGLAADLVFEAYDEVLSANWLTDPEATELIDSVIQSTAVLTVELTLAHLRDVATPEELTALASLRRRAGI